MTVQGIDGDPYVHDNEVNGPRYADIDTGQNYEDLVGDHGLPTNGAEGPTAEVVDITPRTEQALSTEALRASARGILRAKKDLANPDGQIMGVPTAVSESEIDEYLASQGAVEGTPTAEAGAVELQASVDRHPASSTAGKRPPIPPDAQAAIDAFRAAHPGIEPDPTQMERFLEHQRNRYQRGA